MFYKIYDKKFWKEVCKHNKNIFLILNTLLTTVEKFVLKSFEIKNSFLESNCIIKENRIFYICSEEKIFTITFPFEIIESESDILDILFDGEIVDINILKALQRIITIIENTQSYEDFLIEYDSIDESEGFSITELQLASKILKKLFEIEIGYIRFDRDLLASEKHREEYHPEYHLDIFFDRNVSCKIGIKKESFNFKRDIEKTFTKLFGTNETKYFLI